MTPTMLNFGAWILVGLLTYAFIRFGKWSNDSYQYNLRVEGCSEEVIHIFAILFGIGWPLWWLFMFPISLLIGKHGPRWFEAQKRMRAKYGRR